MKKFNENVNEYCTLNCEYRNLRLHASIYKTFPSTPMLQNSKNLGEISSLNNDLLH